MKRLIAYLFRNAGMVALVDLMFALLGLVGLILSKWLWLQILFGFIMIASKILIYGMFGYSASYRGALFINRKKEDKPDGEEELHVKEYAVWKGFTIPAIAETIPFLLLTLGLIVSPVRRVAQVFSGIWYSDFASLCNGFGAMITSDGIGLIALFYIPMLIAVASYGLGYLWGGLKKKRMHRELEAEARTYDL